MYDFLYRQICLLQVRGDGVESVVQYIADQPQPLWGDKACLIQMEGKVALVEGSHIRGSFIRPSVAELPRLQISRSRADPEFYLEGTEQPNLGGPIVMALECSRELHVNFCCGDIEQQDLSWSCHMAGKLLPCHCHETAQTQVFFYPLQTVSLHNWLQSCQEHSYCWDDVTNLF